MLNLETFANDVLVEFKKKIPNWNIRLEKNMPHMRKTFGQYSITVFPNIIREIRHGNTCSVAHIRINFKDVNKVEISNFRKPVFVNISAWSIPGYDFVKDIVNQAIKYHIEYIYEVYETMGNHFDRATTASVEKFLTDNMPGFIKYAES